MFLYIKVNTRNSTIVHKNIKYAATHPYELKSVSKIHWSEVIQ